MRSKLQERIDVHYEDVDVIVIEKAAGILSYPQRDSHEESAIHLIRRYWKFRNNPSRNLYLVHRLDRETSGLMVYAKTTLARNSLQKQFEEHSVLRSYLAVTQGVPSRKEGRLKTFLGRNEKGRRSVTRKGKLAMTRYKVLKVNPQSARSLVRCWLQTGRTHQIRIHLSFLGAPVLGDSVYGNRASAKIALHAESLGFLHPRTNSPLLLQTSIPSDFLRRLAST